MRPTKGHYDYKWIPVEDSHMADISSHFQEAIEFIGESLALSADGNVFVYRERPLESDQFFHLLTKEMIRNSSLSSSLA